ncbi:MAG: hypothetical protein JNK47_12810 [Mesorhizobium sp.]|nr:hypothetical protein [Mesorhizobium sp.]MBL8578101.1 hypothetical protein [Mesorhizobium sp.]
MERWATIVTNDEGQEVISAIAQMEGGAPDVRKGNAKVERIDKGVKIGMVRGGGIEKAGEWGFPGDDPVAKVREKSAAKAEAAKTGKTGRGKKGKDTPVEPETDKTEGEDGGSQQ